MEDRIALVNQILIEVMKKPKVILPEHNLVEDLDLSSLQLMYLIGKIETRFDVVVPIQKLQSIKTVADLHRAVLHLEELST